MKKDEEDKMNENFVLITLAIFTGLLLGLTVIATEYLLNLL